MIQKLPSKIPYNWHVKNKSICISNCMPWANRFFCRLVYKTELSNADTEKKMQVCVLSLVVITVDLDLAQGQDKPC